MPEYLYAYNEDGERYDDSVIGSNLKPTGMTQTQLVQDPIDSLHLTLV